MFQTEDAFQAKKHEIAAILQAHWRGVQARREYKRMRWAVIIMQKYVRRFIAIHRAKKRRRAVNTIRK